VSETNVELARRGYEAALRGDLVEVIDAGDQVVVIMRPIAAGDGPADLSANVTTFRAGKVIEMVHYPNPEDALAAAGVARPD
jgi:hypothetical protein